MVEHDKMDAELAEGGGGGGGGEGGGTSVQGPRKKHVAGLMLVQRRIRWTNINPRFSQVIVLVACFMQIRPFIYGYVHLIYLKCGKIFRQDMQRIMTWMVHV